MAAAAAPQGADGQIHLGALEVEPSHHGLHASGVVERHQRRVGVVVAVKGGADGIGRRLLVGKIQGGVDPQTPAVDLLVGEQVVVHQPPPGVIHEVLGADVGAGHSAVVVLHLTRHDVVPPSPLDLVTLLRENPPQVHHRLQHRAPSGIGGGPLLLEQGVIGWAVCVGGLGRPDDSGQIGGLGQSQLAGIDPEVGAGRSLNAVGPPTPVDGVEVALQDFLFGQFTLELDRQHRLAELALPGALGGEIGVLDVLLGDGGSTLPHALVAQVGGEGPNHGQGVNTRMHEELTILGGQQGQDEHLGDVVVGDPDPVDPARQLGDGIVATAVGVDVRRAHERRLQQRRLARGKRDLPQGVDQPGGNGDAEQCRREQSAPHPPAPGTARRVTCGIGPGGASGGGGAGWGHQKSRRAGHRVHENPPGPHADTPTLDGDGPETHAGAPRIGNPVRTLTAGRPLSGGSSGTRYTPQPHRPRISRPARPV